MGQAGDYFVRKTEPVKKLINGAPGTAGGETQSAPLLAVLDYFTVDCVGVFDEIW